MCVCDNNMLLSHLLQTFILIATISIVIAMKFDVLLTKKQQQQNNLKQQHQQQQHHQHQISTTKPTTSGFCGFIRAMKGIRRMENANNNCNAINLLLAVTLNDNNNFMRSKKQNNDDDKNEDETENEIENRNENDLLSEISSRTVKMSPSASASSSTSTSFPILTTLTLSTTAAATAEAAAAAATKVAIPAMEIATKAPIAAMLTINTTAAAAAPMSIIPLSSAVVAGAATSTSSSLATSAAAAALPQNLKLKRRSLSRPKRYLAFPDGSSFSVAVCFTVGIIGNPRFNYMSFGLNWGVAYDLPNITWVLNHLHGFSRHPVPSTVLRRRTRRSLYKEIERVVDNMGYNGRDCILRALCESRQYFQRTKLSMIGEMLRVIFSLPKQRIFTRELHENQDIKLYDHAYRKARSIDCRAQYDCSFSLLELALGRYSTPPPGYYKEHH